MTETERQQVTRDAVRGARDPQTRRILWVVVPITVFAIVAGFVLGFVLLLQYKKGSDEGLTLAQLVKRDCASGELSGAICGQAKVTEEAVNDAPAALPGAPGQDGSPGADGSPGSPGPSGKPGRDGKPGKDGEDGSDSDVPGPSGASGQPGADSTVPGPQGEKGETGEKGDAGRGVSSVECTSGSGEFTFHYTDGTTETVTCAPPPADPAPSTSPSP